MKSLYYPAVLGSWLFLYFSKLNEIYIINKSLMDLVSNLSFWFGLFLILYFSLTFWSTYSTNSDHYKPCNFLIDLIELIIISISFYFLGFFSKVGLSADYFWFYISMLPLPWLHPIWAKKAGNRIRSLPSSIQTLRFIFYLSGVAFFHQSELFNIIAVLFVFLNIVLLFYEMSHKITYIFLWDSILFDPKVGGKPVRFGIKIINLDNNQNQP
jgi:hypothetical protein